jgi:hypothetical protein
VSADTPSGGPPPASTAATLHQLDHDLRNVLGVLGGGLAALRRHLPPDATDAAAGRAAKALAQLQAGLDRGQDVAARLRALAVACEPASGDPPSCDRGSGAA